MSRLIDLIRKLGQQSSQPIGFGALTGRSEGSRTLALIGRTSPAKAGAELEAVDCGLLDAVILDTGKASSVKAADMQELVWGVASASLGDDDVETLASSGCDFFVIDPATAPAAVISHADAAIIVELGEPLDVETAAAMNALNVDGSLNTSGFGSDRISFQDLVGVQRIGVSTGGVMLIEARAEVTISGLTALRDAGVAGLVVPMSDAGFVLDIGQKIRELPPRRREIFAPGSAHSSPRSPTVGRPVA